MKRLRIVALLVALLVMGMSLVQIASADPISPPSAGCQIAFVSASETSFTLASSFYDGDTLHFSTDVAVNIHVTDMYSIVNTTYSNVTNLNYTIPHSLSYTFVVTPASGSGSFFMNLSCSSTPISGSCIVTNDNFTGGITYQGTYDAGEKVHVTSDFAVNFTVSGTANVSFPHITNQYYIFPTSGAYTLTVQQSDRGTTATGTVTCTLPRRR